MTLRTDRRVREALRRGARRPPSPEALAPWHMPTCPLFEVDPSDCAYYPTLCDCGFRAPEEDAP